MATRVPKVTADWHQENLPACWVQAGLVQQTGYGTRQGTVPDHQHMSMTDCQLQAPGLSRAPCTRERRTRAAAAALGFRGSDPHNRTHLKASVNLAASGSLHS